MKKLRFHPACLIFPQLGREELLELAAHIKNHGLQHPIVLYQGMILDGRNRYLACKIAGVKPRFVQWKGKGSPLAWVISENLIRRHLTSSQRAVVAHDLLPMLEKEAKERQRLSQGRGKKVGKNLPTFSGNGKASEMAAQLMKTNGNYVKAVKHIGGKAPELLGRIRSGMLNVPDAVKLAKLPRAKRQRLLKQCNGETLDQTMYDERYSPLWAIKGAQQVMGRIDLDPASCSVANARVRATTYYDSEMDGLAQSWSGRVFLNVPYTNCSQWIRKLSAEVGNGNVKQAILLCPVRVLSLIVDSCRPLLTGSLLFPTARIKYMHGASEKLVGTAFASFILYVGPNQRQFARVFGKHGIVYQPASAG
jgi:hypothetical protein